MKNIFLVTIFLAFAHGSWGQASIGPVMNLNFSNALGGKGGNTFKTGFDAGLYLQLNFTEIIAVHSEILYSRKGYKRHAFYNISGVASDTNVAYTLSYLGFPFLAHFAVSENIYLRVGPQIGFLINGKQTGSITATANGGPPAVKVVDTDTVYGFSTTEYSFVLGGGYTLPMGLSTYLGFTYGITNLYETSSIAHNFSIAISASAPFSIFRRGGVSKGAIRRRI